MGGTSTDVSALRRRVRARLRDPGRRRAHARADDEHPHRRRRRRLDPAPSTARAFASGRESAPAPIPGPACYRRGGPLTVTDCQRDARQDPAGALPARVRPARRRAARRATSCAAKFAALAAEVAARHRQRRARRRRSPRASCEIAVGEHGQRDQAASRCARLRRHRVHAAVLRRRRRPARLPRRRRARHDARVHPSARRRAVGLRHGPRRPERDARGGGRAAARPTPALAPARARSTRSAADARAELARQGVAAARSRCARRVHLRYEGTDTALVVPLRRRSPTMRAAFEAAYRQRFAFLMPERRAGRRGGVGRGGRRRRCAAEPRRVLQPSATAPRRRETTCACSPTALARRRRCSTARTLRPGDAIDGPAIIAERNATTVVEPGWRARVTRARPPGARARAAARGAHARSAPRPTRCCSRCSTTCSWRSPSRWALQLQNTAYSVNIKERLDFSCALFDADGQPDRQRAAHAGAPGLDGRIDQDGDRAQRRHDAAGRRLRAERSVQRRHAPARRHGDHAGVPRRRRRRDPVLRRLARPPRRHRRHHAGSMPPFSTTLDEEGVLLDNFQLVARRPLARGRDARAARSAARYPARNLEQNLADLRRRSPPTRRACRSCARWSRSSASTVVRAYMRHVQDNAEESVRRVIDVLKDGALRATSWTTARVIRVDDHASTRAARSATIDFTGTSAQLPNNFNAPSAVCMAAVLYVFRTLVDDDIPLNAGCLKPLQVDHPRGLDAEPALPGGGRRGQRRDLAVHHRRALRRARRDGRRRRAR